MQRLPAELLESITVKSWYLLLDRQDHLHLMKTSPSSVNSGFVHITVSYSFPHAHTLTAISDLFSWKLSISHGPAFTVDTVV
ncbi:hypothetical protein ARMGADRAFT_429570 [Armillaria gallica]|uniref:Uncharacterized protein n=1 Tax=Armillaria gallica TaxID=47427 RepID=A0A2H3CZ93_ARMGA|nr:hypothetical protein ARMGADRAFT_429570 [Armillaria gallica]